jgi:hypothetical protein
VHAKVVVRRAAEVDQGDEAGEGGNGDWYDWRAQVEDRREKVESHYKFIEAIVPRDQLPRVDRAQLVLGDLEHL